MVVETTEPPVALVAEEDCWLFEELVHSKKASSVAAHREFTNDEDTGSVWYEAHGQASGHAIDPALDISQHPEFVRLQRENQRLHSQNVVLVKNISRLFITAKKELQERMADIQKLSQSKDQSESKQIAPSSNDASNRPNRKSSSQQPSYGLHGTREDPMRS